MEHESSLSRVSVVVCTKNAVDSIRTCLESLSNLPVLEVIVVDASSTDGTVDIVSQFGHRLVTDEGKGLGAARNLGISLTSGEFVLNLGPDNTITRDSLKASISFLETSNCAGISFTTAIQGSNYLAKALNFWRSVRFRTGPAKVIGTPSLFYSNILKLHPFSANRVYSDDGELCDRLVKLGYKFAIGPGECHEHGKTRFKIFFSTWKLYGLSDFEHFQHHLRQNAKLTKLVSSLLHPFRVEFVRPLRHDFLTALPYIPILLLMSSFRYWGWITACQRERRTRNKQES